MGGDQEGGDEDYHYLFQVTMIGDSGVGKSSLMMRFTENTFLPDTRSTIGLDFASKTIPVRDFFVKAQIWDTAGQERYRGMSRSYYRKTNGVLIVYDVSQRESFRNCEFWLKEIKEHAKPDVVVLLVGNKADMTNEREVTTAEGKKFAQENQISFIEASARDNSNVDQAFQMCVEEIYNRQIGSQVNEEDEKPSEAAKKDLKASTTEVIQIKPEPEPPKAQGGCAC